MSPLVQACTLVVAAAISVTVPAAAQIRPSEDDMFGESSKGAAPAAIPGLSVPATAVFSNDTATADPITLGGQIYLRAQSSGLLNQQAEDYAFSIPTLLDVYLDARPNDRVRGFVLGRLSYDPMLPDRVSTAPTVGTSATNSGTSGTPLLSSLYGTQSNTPHVLLDQLWLRFDLWRSLFLTVGRQHVRWGTARFWSPADLLHPQRRNPLDVFDARRGNDMIKLHLPIESTAWNFYAYGIWGGYNDTPTLYSISGAARAEFVAGSNELGLAVLLRRGVKPKFAGDLSMALGPFDLYAEAAVLDASEVDRVMFTRNALLPDPPPSTGSMVGDVLQRIQQAVDTYFPSYREHGYRPQIAGGVSFTQNYGANDAFTLSLEYFYNTLGYRNAEVYPGLVFPRTTSLQDPARSFYLGEHYAAIALSFPAPFSLDLHSFSLSTLCNISDRSCLSRFDYSVQLLTHLRFELFIAAVYGRQKGEFTFGIEMPNIDGVRLGREPAIFNAGLALRIGI